ncbi:MAG: hypothetical protein ABSG53_29310 [Thermoguttaceae bacterium]
MPIYSWLLSSLLVSQVGGDPSVPMIAAPPPTNLYGPAVPAKPYPGNETPTHPIAGQVLNLSQPSTVSAGVAQPPAVAARPTTAQLVADALTLPPGSTISGQPVSLVSVVATVPGRQRQIGAVHAYWRLAEAVGEYHFCHERQQRIAPLRAENGEAADLLRAVQAVATAQMREAEMQVTTAQHDLAEILLLAPSTPLPLPEDRPLIGPYRTLFAELFAGKKAPEHARMLDQTLPLRNRAVESHAAALLAAEDLLDATIELQTTGQERLVGVLAALDAQIRQQRAFLAAVCRYNHDIADYALLVVSPQTTPDILVGTLIKQNRPAGQPVTPLPTTATLPATYLQQRDSAGISPASGSVGVPAPIPNGPTRAVRPSVAAGQTPVAAPPVQVQETAPNHPPPMVVSPDPLRSNEPEEPRLAPPQESAIPLVPEKPEGPASLPTGAKSTDGPTIRSSQKPISENGPANALPLKTHSEGLVNLTPAERTVKLTTALFCDRDRPLPAGAPVGLNAGKLPTLRLIDCLRTVPADSRARTIETYWGVRQTAAQYQSFVEQIQWLEALKPTLSTQNPPPPTAILKLRSACLAVKAERADTEAGWMIARFQLASAAGFGTEKTVPQATSLPFVGRLPLPASSSDHSWPRRRLEATIPQREQAILDQATAVVEADASRATATAEFLAGRSSVERVLAGIEIQARETSAFLRAVTEYNRVIVQYATATLPTDIEAEKLVAALMVE